MMVPPFDVIAAVSLMRLTAASAAVVFVRLMPPPFSVMAEVLSRAWLKPASLSVWPTLMAVEPLQPPVLVPLNVSVLPTMPPSTPPESVTFPVPPTAPVMTGVIGVSGEAATALSSVTKPEPVELNESVLDPALIVKPVKVITTPLVMVWAVLRVTVVAVTAVTVGVPATPVPLRVMPTDIPTVLANDSVVVAADVLLHATAIDGAAKFSPPTVIFPVSVAVPAVP